MIYITDCNNNVRIVRSQTKNNILEQSKENVKDHPQKSGSIEQYWRKPKKNNKKKFFGYQCWFPCTYPCIAMGIFAAILILSAIAAAITGVGHHYTSEIPENALDQNNTTKYTNFGNCNNTLNGSIACGTNTGFFLTLRRGLSLLLAIRFCAANSMPDRDPMTITIEGSNQPSLSLIVGSTGLNPDPGRYNYGIFQLISSNTIYYHSYRILITSKRSYGDSTQYGEVEMFGI